MDRTTWIAVGLSILGIILWQFYYTKNYPRPTPQPTAEEAADPAALAAATPTPSPTPAPPPLMAPRRETLQASDAEYIFNNDTGGIEEVLLLLHLGKDRESVFLNRDRMMPIGALGTELGEALGGFLMTTNRARGEVLFEKTDEDGLLIEKTFTLPHLDDADGKYQVAMHLRFRNTSDSTISRGSYFVSTGSAAPIHERDLPMYTRFDWFREGRMRSIDVNWFNAGSIPLTGIQTRPARETYEETRDAIAWAAVASQYFCTIVTADEPDGTFVWARRFEAERQRNGRPAYGIQGGLGFGGFQLEPGAEITREFQIYAGPKEFSRLRAMGEGQQAVMRFGMFRIISELLLWSMNNLYKITGNYAGAIIILTLIIKSLLWPVQNKATNSMRKMAALSPKMTELREKFKDDPQKMNQELMKLYKDYGVNPFSGCLPLLIQIPIFFGFYSMLGVAIELRNASFLWISDLSQPDTIGHILGFPINLLPIIMAGTMIWQIAITPKTGDAMQQRIFYFMPVIFLVFCYNFASALALYWTTQNIFSIVQLYLTRNRPLPVLEKKSAPKPEAAPDRKKKKNRRRNTP